MSKPGEFIECRENVIKAYLKCNTVLPLIFIDSVGENSGYYYRFIPELSTDLLNCSTNVRMAEDLLGIVEEKLKRMKFIKELPLRNEVKIIDQDEDQIIKLWLSLWWKTFSSHGFKEHHYRLTQLLDLLSRWQTKSMEQRIEVYSDIIRTCHEQGSERLTVTFFNSITSIEIRSNAVILCYYLQAISSNNTTKTLFEVARSFNKNIFEETKSVSLVDSRDTAQSDRRPFRQRTFLSEKIGNVISEEIKLGIFIEDCERCKKPDEEIILNHEKIPHRQCKKCKEKLNTKLKIRIGRPIIYFQDQPLYWEENVNIIPIEELSRAIESMWKENNSLELHTLRNNETIFWNIIWHFTIQRLPYDLFLPYRIEARRSLVVENSRGVIDKLDKDGIWFDQFKQVRTFVLCKDSETQTDS